MTHEHSWKCTVVRDGCTFHRVDVCLVGGEMRECDHAEVRRAAPTPARPPARDELSPAALDRISAEILFDLGGDVRTRRGRA